MKKAQIVLFSLLCLLYISGRSQTAPITTAGSVTNAVPGSISIPVIVSNFNNIGAITLTLDYNPAVLSFQSATHNPAFTGMQIAANTPGRILISWFAIASGVTLPDLNHMLDITFTYSGGSTYLSWYDNGESCEYIDYESGDPLPDQPTASYYNNGIVTNHAAPVTTAPFITDVTGSSVTVPITVTNFTNIMVISLTLEYDPNVLIYQGAVPNAVFVSGFFVNSLPSTGGKRKIIISYMGSPISYVHYLPDRSHLVDLLFNYTNQQGANYSELTWKDDGNSCEYADQFNNALLDSPSADYYQNGLVTSQVSPVTILPTITNAVAGPLDVPVKVLGFSNTKVLSLTFVYDPAIMTYTSNTPNAVFGGRLIVSDLTLPSGMKKIVMSWLGDSPVSIADSGTLTTLHFNYISGTTTLAWSDNGTSCEYADEYDNAFWDSPTATYYIDGLVSGHTAPRTKAETICMASVEVPVSVPINVWNFTHIGSFSLTLDYDPGVLTYNSCTPNPSIAANLTVSASPGRILMGWFYTGLPGTSLSFPDSTQLMTLNFTYHGGTSPLIFYNNGETCEYTEGVTNAVLNDLPTGDYYINGSVTSVRTLNIKAYIEGLYNSSAHQMNQARNAVATQYPGTTADQISVELHDAANYSHTFYTVNSINLSTSGVASVPIPAIYSSSYYITIRHWNTIETVSAAPVSFTGNIIGYAFDAAAKAYGSNLKLLPDGKWAIFSGDVNQDGSIDASDLVPADNDAALFAKGYLVTDLNGDGKVDTADITILDNNSTNFIRSITP